MAFGERSNALSGATASTPRRTRPPAGRRRADGALNFDAWHAFEPGTFYFVATAATRDSDAADRPMRLPRSTGALAGVISIVLGAWAALIPFVGPYFHYAFGNYDTWHYTSNRLWLNILPGALAIVGGLMLLRSSRRAGGVLSGWLAVAAGAWLVIGPSVSLLWHRAGNPIGAPTGGHVRQAVELLGYFFVPGVLIVAFAAFAMGRFVSRPRLAEEPLVAAGAAGGAVAERRRRGGLFGRRRRAADDETAAATTRAGGDAPDATSATREAPNRADR
jgi:hypothetical protein